MFPYRIMEAMETWEMVVPQLEYPVNYSPSNLSISPTPSTSGSVVNVQNEAEATVSAAESPSSDESAEIALPLLPEVNIDKLLNYKTM